MDEKQWLVSRLDVANSTIFDEFQLAKEDLMKIREDLTFSITSKRNYVLSSVVFVSVLLVTLYEIKLVNTEYFLSILILDLSIGLITFIISIQYIKSTKSAFIKVENSIVSIQQELHHNFGFLIYNTSELNNVSITTLREYRDFFRALTGIIYIPFSNALMQSSKSRLLDAYYRKFFVDSAIAFEELIESAINEFKNVNKQNLPKGSLDYVTKIIPTYKKPSTANK